MNYSLGNHRLTEIYSYEEFLENSEKLIAELENTDLDETEQKLLEYRKINLIRSLRIAKTYKPNEKLLRLFGEIKEKQTWLIFTEDWCGDSAQNLPYLMKYTEPVPNIDVKIILRDDNIKALKDYFGNDAPLSIPKIIAFDENGKEIFKWGPRPREVQNLISGLKKQNITRDELNKKLHLWYARNKGRELEKEFIEILSKTVNR